MKDQAERIIHKLGGHVVVASVLKIDVSQVYRWTYPKGKRGGTGGLIPAVHHQALLNYAVKNGIALTPYDFFEEIPKKKHKRRISKESAAVNANSCVT